MKHIPFILAFLFLFNQLSSQDVPINVFEKDIPRKHEKEFQFLAFFLTQGVSSNIYPENSLLKGQVIGRMFGVNSATTTDSLKSVYAEQRLIPFFIYQPKLFNGKAILRASFEIDWTWGDVAYGTGGNFGSSVSADQVNLQTQNIELELIPAKKWKINLGLQRMYDSPYNAYRTFFDKMTETGYRLMYWGTDGVGISVRRDADFNRFKAGHFLLYENLIQLNDDVSMSFLMYEQNITKLWKLGGSVHYVRDRANGAGGVSILGQGLNATLLNGYNGTFKFNFGSTPYKADIFWFGTFFSRNQDYMADRFRLSGFFNYNYGKTQLEQSEDNWEDGPSIGGFSANALMSYRHGQTTNDVFQLDLIYTSGDDNNLTDDAYSGVLTGNMWGAPGGIYVSSGAYLLFPSLNVVNRFTPVVSDISNMGYGLTGATLSLKKDIIPHQLNVKAGSAFAMSNVEPRGGGNILGNEYFGAVEYSFGPFMSVGLHGAYLSLGDFFDSNDATYSSDINGISEERPLNPWTAFIVFKWLLF